MNSTFRTSVSIKMISQDYPGSQGNKAKDKKNKAASNKFFHFYM